MDIQCPKCKSPHLSPTRLESGLPAAGCGECHGALLSLLYYRDWAERLPEDECQHESMISQVDEVMDVHETPTAMACPKCRRLMRKYLLSGQTTHRLDLCTSCDEVWLDNGEWQLIKSLSLAAQVPKVFTDAWQAQVRKEKMQQERDARLQQKLSDEDFVQAKALREWLHQHPQRHDILFYVNQE